MALRAPPCGVTASDPSFLAGPVRFAAVDPDRWRIEPTEAATAAGFRFGARGAHGSRTIMLADLTELFRAVPPEADAAAYSGAIVEENALGKATLATRRESRQRLREIYGLDPGIPVFRVLRRLWTRDAPGRPILALLTALARDPLLRLSAPAILPLSPGAVFQKSRLRSVIRAGAGHRFTEGMLDKIARYTASSWTQAGHLAGRVRKVRRRVEPTPGALAFAVWLGEREGLGGEALLESRWAEVLDRPLDELTAVAHQAHRLELVDLRAGGGIFDLRTRSLDPGENPAP